MSRQKLLTYLRPWCHWLLLAIPLLMPLSAWTMSFLPPILAASIPLLALFVLLPLADYGLGRDSSNLPDSQNTLLERRLLPVLCVPAQFLMLYWSIGFALELPALPALAWCASLGVIGGILAINVAHELIHRRAVFDRLAGGVLLSMVNYAGFKVEHLRSHHLYVATPKDASTARLNQSVYTFVLKSVWHNPFRAWQLERTRLTRKGLPVWHWQNELIWWNGLSLMWCVLCAVLFGPLGVVVYLLQGVIAAATLEVINYIEHYGLLRQQLPDGRYEPPNPNHSWNSDYFLSNAILLQLQRHADHHANPVVPFPYLRHQKDAPQLPLGYAAMFSVALIPPLWRRIMNPRINSGQGC